jgi:hypothetical protein
MTPMNANELDAAPSSARHPGPPLGVLALVHTILFLSGLYFVVTFSGGPHFPGPWEPADVIARYFREQPSAVLMCAFLQFGAAVPLGLFVASTVSRLQFLGVRAAGVVIALFGGFMTAIDMAAAAMILWVMAYPGIAQDAALVRALYYLSYAFGGPGFSVPFGLFVAGVSVAAGFAKLIPKWLVGFGLVLAVVGELSWFNLVSPKALPLIPLTRFPGFVWLIASGFLLPNRGR